MRASCVIEHFQKFKDKKITLFLSATREDSLQGASGEGLKVRVVVVLQMKLGELTVAQKFHIVENKRSHHFFEVISFFFFLEVISFGITIPR